MTKVEVDREQVRQLAVELGRVPDRADRKLRQTIQQAGIKIKHDLQREAQETSYFPGVAASITYETWKDETGYGVDIGPEVGHPRKHPRAQGGLAWIAYYGHARTGPTFPDPQGALDREAGHFQRYLADAVTEDML